MTTELKGEEQHNPHKASVLLEQLSILGRHVEIAHFPSVDIVVNKDADLSTRAAELVELFRDGIPNNWETLDPDNIHVFTDNLDGHKFLAKRRYWVGGSSDLARIGDYKEKEFAIPRHLYSLNSVLNEVSLAPKIKRLMKSAEAQEIVKNYGFAGIDYIEPIIAFIDKNSGQKGAVYEYVNAIDAHKYLDKSVNEFAFSANDWDAVTTDIRKFIAEYGIRPIDLRPKDMLIDVYSGLHLIDAEAFYSSE